jgi:hypothetical protein
MEFKFITVDELRGWWGSIRPGIEKIKSKSPENWIVEDVYTDLFNQKSMLFVVLENNHFKGFFILQPLGQELHVWAAWTLENDYLIVEKGLKYIKQLASNGNAKYLTFSSHRRGWQRRAEQLGFRPRKWICEV